MAITISTTTMEASALGTTVNAMDDAALEYLLGHVRAAARIAKLTRARGASVSSSPAGQTLQDLANVRGDAAAANFLGRNPSSSYAAALAHGAAIATAYIALRGLYFGSSADAALVQLDQLQGASHAA